MTPAIPVFLALLVGAASAAEAKAARPAGKAPFKLLYNNDATNVWSCNSPFHERGEPITDEAIAGSIDEVADKGVDAYMLSPGLGHFPWWKSKVVPDHYQWWMQKTGMAPDQYGQYLLAGGDWVKVLVERCRKRGMAPFVSLRLNDVHMMEFCGEKHVRSSWASRFYTEHPEYWLEPDHKTKWPSGYSDRRGLNWAEPAVRDYKLSLITELCERYDLDGFELDFLREDVMFRDDVPMERRVEIITEFVRRVRAVLDRTATPGQRRWLSARVPLELRRWAGPGLDVQRLVEAGVDMLNCSGSYHTIVVHDLAKIRELAPNAAIYQELTHSAGTIWFIAERSGYGTVGHPRTWDAQFYTAAHLAHERGADGISLFNFVYYRSSGRGFEWLEREPPFHVLPHLRDPEWLARQPQHYWLGQWSYLNQLSRRIEPGATRTFRFDVALPEHQLQTTTRLRLHAEDPIDDAEMTVEFNGVELQPTADTSGFLDNPYDRMLSDAPRRRAWLLPLDLVRNGINEVRVTLAKGKQPVKVTWMDMAVQ